MYEAPARPGETTTENIAMADVENRYKTALDAAASDLEKFHPWALADVDRILTKFDEGVWVGGASDDFRSDVQGRRQPLTNAVDARIGAVADKAATEPAEVDENDPRADWEI